jgi:type II secretory pathway pseudopilin PulG
VSGGAVLVAVAVILAVATAALFRLAGVLDAAELQLRRAVAGLRGARKAVETAAELAGAVERDAAEGRQALSRLEALKHPPGAPAGPAGAGPRSLPHRPGPAPR